MVSIEQVCRAIQGHNVVRVNYEGHNRIIEPHLVGEKTNGSIVLSAWQIGGYSESGSQPPWRNYTLQKINNFVITTETFTNSRQGYNPNDRTMKRIICRI